MIVYKEKKNVECLMQPCMECSQIRLTRVLGDSDEL